MHKWPILWALHKVHHSATVLTPMTVFRTHPLEGIIFSLRSSLTQAISISSFVFLFGDVVLADSRNSAINLSKSGFKTITIDGEFFEARNTSLVIDINSKISKLTKIINMSDSVDGLQSMISSLRKTVQKKKSILKKIDEMIKSYEKRLSNSESGMTVTNNSYTDLKQKINTANQTHTQF